MLYPTVTEVTRHGTPMRHSFTLNIPALIALLNATPKGN